MSSKPSEKTEKQLGIKQIPFRLHKNDHQTLKSRCATDGFGMQCLLESCVIAYLNGDQHIRLLASENRKLNRVNKKQASWSPRESDILLNEIESLQGDEDNE